MRGITLWPEWLWAIVHLGKSVENRSVPPYKTFLGQRIALHAGKKVAGTYNPTSQKAWQGFDGLIDMALSVGIHSFYLGDANRITGIAWTAKKDIKGLRSETTVHSLEGTRLEDLMFDELPVGAIVGTVEILSQSSYYPNPYLESPCPWAAPGQYQWKMRDLRVLPQPIPMKGKQGPFIVPHEIEAQIVASIGG